MQMSVYALKLGYLVIWDVRFHKRERKNMQHLYVWRVPWNPRAWGLFAGMVLDRIDGKIDRRDWESRHEMLNNMRDDDAKTWKALHPRGGFVLPWSGPKP